MKYFVSALMMLFIFFSCAIPAETTYLGTFDNKTDDDYIVYQRAERLFGGEGPVFVEKAADWSPVLIVRAHEKGEEKILFRDPNAIGMQIKLVPQREGAQVFYLKSGIKESGECERPWLTGPLSLDIALTEESLNASIKNYNEVRRVRYCGYRETSGMIEIYPDDVRLVGLHNMHVIDNKKVSVREIKEEMKK